MIRLAISVEGQTEDEFCKNMLAPYFAVKGIYITPVIIQTSRRNCGIKNKGGCVNIDRVKNEVSKLLSSFDFVTTFYDLYGFNDIPKSMSADELENKIKNLFPHCRNLIPYIQKYEFETLLFSDSSYYEELLDEKAKESFESIIDEFNGEIENINNSKETAPSKRVMKIFDDANNKFDKVYDGFMFCDDVGLEKIRAKAPRFSQWITNIEKISL